MLNWWYLLLLAACITYCGCAVRCRRSTRSSFRIFQTDQLEPWERLLVISTIYTARSSFRWRQSCGGVAENASWILTMSHCVVLVIIGLLRSSLTLWSGMLLLHWDPLLGYRWYCCAHADPSPWRFYIDCITLSNHQAAHAIQQQRQHFLPHMQFKSKHINSCNMHMRICRGIQLYCLDWLPVLCFHLHQRMCCSRSSRSSWCCALLHHEPNEPYS